MARTERRNWIDDNHVRHFDDSNGRDRKPRCYCCGGWLREDRRRRRHQAKAALMRGED